MEGLIWIHENLHSSGFINHFFKFITILGNDGYIWIALGTLLLFFKKTRKTGIVMFASLLIGFIFNDLVLKNLIERVRPFNVNPSFKEFILGLKIELPSSFSFPSGHSYSSLNCAMVIALMHKKWGWTSLILAFLIAFSRMFLLIHYPTDVLAGIIFGILNAFLVVYLYRKLCRIVEAKQRNKIIIGK